MHAVTDRGRLAGLDSLRGFAAIAVLICHVFFLAKIPVPRTFTTTAGHFALSVELFFMLSAFSLCIAYYGQLKTQNAIGTYFLRRFLRIAPLFYFFFAVWFFYRGFGGFVPIHQYILTATFLFGFTPDTSSSTVAVGWSIGVEMMFYAIFPLLILVVRGIKSAAVALAISLVVGHFSHIWAMSSLPASPFVRTNFAVQMPMFMLGLCTFFIYQSAKEVLSAKQRIMLFWTSIVVALVTWVVIFLCIGLPPNTHARNSFWLRMAICAPFPLLVLGFAFAPLNVIVNRATILLGDYSYGIYLWHSFIIVNTASWRERLLSPDALGDIWVSFAVNIIVVAAITIAAAAATFYAIEVPFRRLGHRRGAPHVVRPEPAASAAT